MTDTLNLDTLKLAVGKHNNRDTGVCLLEATAWFAGEPNTDHPKCVSAYLGAYGRALNDRLSDENRQKLIPFIPRLVGTANDGKDDIRQWMAADWAIRVATPRYLDAANMPDEAALLRALPPIVDRATADAARSTARGVRDAAWAARAAARADLVRRVKEELQKRGLTNNAVEAAAVAEAAAAAVAEAAAAAVAEAAAAAAVAEAAAAAAAAAAVAAAAVADISGLAYGSASYWTFRDRVRDEIRRIWNDSENKSAIAQAVQLNNAEGIALLGKMIDAEVPA